MIYLIISPSFYFSCKIADFVVIFSCGSTIYGRAYNMSYICSIYNSSFFQKERGKNERRQECKQSVYHCATPGPGGA